MFAVGAISNEQLVETSLFLYRFSFSTLLPFESSGPKLIHNVDPAQFFPALKVTVCKDKAVSHSSKDDECHQFHPSLLCTQLLQGGALLHGEERKPHPGSRAGR